MTPSVSKSAVAGAPRQSRTSAQRPLPPRQPPSMTRTRWLNVAGRQWRQWKSSTASPRLVRTPRGPDQNMRFSSGSGGGSFSGARAAAHDARHCAVSATASATDRSGKRGFHRAAAR